MQRIDKDGYHWINIEDEYPNLRYVKADGIYDIGESKNVYIEEYADDDRIRYYLPDDTNYANKSTQITMTFIVIGDPVSRQETIDAFLDYVRKGVHKYWDDARKHEFSFIVKDEVKVSNERWHGTDPYVEIQIPMTNLNGSTKLLSTSPVIT